MKKFNHRIGTLTLLAISLWTSVLVFADQEPQENENQKIESIKLKKDFQYLDKKEQTKLLEKIETVQKGDKKSRTLKALLQKTVEENKAFQEEAKFKKDTLSDEEKNELKDELAKRRNRLKTINDQIKQDLDQRIKREFSDNELKLIDSISPNFLFEIQNFTDDTELANQWSLNSIGTEAFATESTEKPIIAIIDTGIDTTHEDLSANLWKRETCVDENGNTIEGGCMNGGYDFVDNDDNPFATDYAHGTAVAGLIGAQTNNQTGIASLSNNQAEIMALRSCCTAEGFFEEDSIIKAIHFAVNNGADVINMSFGGPSASDALKNAIQYAEDHQVLVTAAAGNYGMNSEEFPVYPASFDNENIISVAAHGSDGNLASFSNYGSTMVDLMAPGINVLSTALSNQYQALSGTSFSAPLVASSLVRYLANGTNPISASAELLSEVNIYDGLLGVIGGGRKLEFGERNGGEYINDYKITEVWEGERDWDDDDFFARAEELGYEPSVIMISLNSKINSVEEAKNLVSDFSSNLRETLLEKMNASGYTPAAHLLSEDAFSYESYSGKFLDIRYNWSDEVDSAIEELLKDSRTKYVEPNSLQEVPSIQSELEISSIEEESLPENSPKFQALVDGINEYTVSSSARAVVVAVIDNGFDYNHETVPKQFLWDGSACVNFKEDKVGEDLGGCIYGYDTYSKDRDPFDTSSVADFNKPEKPLVEYTKGEKTLGHGTKVLGLLLSQAAKLNNPNINIKFMLIRVGSKTNSSGSIKDAILFAKENGADIISMSLTDNSSIIKPVIESLSDTLLVVGAGNYKINNDLGTDDSKPCFYDDDHIFCIAAMNEENTELADENDWGSGGSNWGVQSVDIAAIGHNVPTINTPTRWRPELYTNFGGTSAATPQVAGLAALVLAENIEDENYTYLNLKSDIEARGILDANLTGKIRTGKKLATEDNSAGIDDIPEDNTPTINFSDVPENAWYVPFIEHAALKEIINGNPDGTYEPSDEVNRVEALKMAYLSAGLEVESTCQNAAGEFEPNLPFSDIESDQWYCPYVKDALNKGFLENWPIKNRESQTGLSFLPAQTMSRLDVAILISDVFDVDFLNIDDFMNYSQKRKSEKTYSDFSAEDTDYSAVRWMSNAYLECYGSDPQLSDTEKFPIVEGYRNAEGVLDGTFRPENSVNRAEMAKIVINTKNYLDKYCATSPFSVVFGTQSIDTSTTIGYQHEQTIDENNTNAPIIQFTNTSLEIMEGETTNFELATNDADGDELSYAWYASNGELVAIDTTRFHEVNWIAPEVNEDTEIEIRAIAGDGRGKVGKATLIVTVKNNTESTVLNPENFDVVSTTDGGLWTDPNTWIGGVVPSSSDKVLIDGNVQLNQGTTTVLSLGISSNGLFSNTQTAQFYVNQDIINYGTITRGIAQSFEIFSETRIKNYGQIVKEAGLFMQEEITEDEESEIEAQMRTNLYIITKGEIYNEGLWAPYQTETLAETEIKNTTTIDGVIYSKYHDLVVNTPNTVTFADYVGSNAKITGTGTVKFQKNVSEANISNPEIWFTGDIYQTITGEISPNAEKIVFSGIGEKVFQPEPLTGKTSSLTLQH